MQQDCIFCKIVAGRLPACKIYEDQDILAFMDIGPIIKGHALVIPKTHYELLTQAPAELLGSLIKVVQKIARGQLSGIAADAINVMQNNGRAAGQLVPHIHFHVIPRFLKDGHSWNWQPRSYSDPAEMQEIAAKIKLALNHTQV